MNGGFQVSANEREAELLQALRREELRAEAMIEVGSSLTQVRNLDELLVQVVERITQLMESDRSSLFLVDREKGIVWSKIAQGAEIKEIRVALGQGIAGWVADTGQIVNIPDAYADSRFNPGVDKLTGYQTRTILCVPLTTRQGEVLGAIQTLNKKSRVPFSVHDERLLKSLASQICIAIEHTRLLGQLITRNAELTQTQDQLHRKVEELDVLYSLETAISASFSVDDILQRVLRRAVELVDCEAGSVVLSTDERDELYFANAVGSREDRVKRLRLPKGAGIAGWVAQHGETALVNHPLSDPRHPGALEKDLDFPVRNILAVPIAVSGETLGALELLNKRGGPFEPHDAKLATVIAGQAMAAVQMGRVREEWDKENRLASIGKMLSGIIHDFRTPMTIISGYMQLMAMEDDAAVRAQQSEIVLKQFDFINDMTHELLAFARGESTLLPVVIHLDRLLQEMVDLLTPELKSLGIELSIADHYLGTVRADENKLRRLIYNIARNATQAMPDGGRFSIELEDRGEFVLLSFADTGPGIPAQIQDRLFQSFVTMGKKDGTGLGLALVKRIVDEHGGRVEVENLVPKGACFRIWLPKRLEGSESR